MSINRPDPDLTDVQVRIFFSFILTGDGFLFLCQIPEDVLSKVLIGRCARDFQYACAPPEGEVFFLFYQFIFPLKCDGKKIISQLTDFNMWDTSLDTELLREWTSCK